MLRGLAKHHEVTLLSFADQPEVNPDSPEIRGICQDVYVVPWREFDPNSMRARFGFLSLTPRSLIDTFSKEMADKIISLISERDYDIVVASQLSMAAYRPYFANTPAVFEEVEIGLNFTDSPSLELKQRLRRAFTWFKLRIYLSRLLDSFQACTVASRQERELLAQNFKMDDKIDVIPNGVQMSEYEDHRSSLVFNQLVFSGSFRYHANYDAMVWFVREVFPQVLEQIPETHLVITGDHANLPLPSMKNVTLAGYVDDIKTLISSSCVSIAPLLAGGGTRLKILEAMALGVPVVSTSKGAEGLDAVPGEHILIADKSTDFSVNVVKLLRDGQLRMQITSNAMRLVSEKYDWEVVLPNFLRIVERTADSV